MLILYIAGYFRDPVWDQYVLKACHTEPAVLHAVHALGALHEERLMRKRAHSKGVDVTRTHTSFHVKQYSKALAGLQNMLSQPEVPMDLVMMCSLLFIHFEALRECFIPALVHTENAIRLLHSSTVFGDKPVDESLVRTLMRIDVQGTMYLGMRVPSLPVITQDLDNEIPEQFANLTHARDFINIWTCRMYHFMRTGPDGTSLQQDPQIPFPMLLLYEFQLRSPRISLRHDAAELT